MFEQRTIRHSDRAGNISGSEPRGPAFCQNSERRVRNLISSLGGRPSRCSKHSKYLLTYDSTIKVFFN
jgi:hypothetical protein